MAYTEIGKNTIATCNKKRIRQTRQTQQTKIVAVKNWQHMNKGAYKRNR
jgi:hypothetical protein